MKTVTDSDKQNLPHYQVDYYKGILGVYNRRIMKSFIRMGDLKSEKGLIFDFGCGVGHLKQELSNRNVVGYDINPDLSDIGDYTKLKPTKIVCSASLQYLTLGDINNLLIFFHSTRADLITVIPTENVLAKLAMVITNKPYAHDDHLSKYREINQIIEKYYCISKRKYMWGGMVQLTRYRIRP